MAAQNLKHLFEKHTVADMPAPKILIEIDSKAQLIDGFEVRFLSFVVFVRRHLEVDSK